MSNTSGDARDELAERGGGRYAQVALAFADSSLDFALVAPWRRSSLQLGADMPESSAFARRLRAYHSV
jgi:hypothetical protein